MFILKRPIDPSSSADESDVINTKTALSTLGFFQGPIDPIPTQDMIEGLQHFQAASGLPQDGIMKPQGPTEAALDLALRHIGGRGGRITNRVDRQGLLSAFNRQNYVHGPRDGKCRATGTCDVNL